MKKPNQKEKQMCKIFNIVKSAIVDGLTRLDRPYAGDLHNELYGEPQHYIYANAKEAADELDVDACRATNMLVSIMGYELLQSIYGNTEYFVDKWNGRLSADDLADMLTLAEKWFEENPDGLQEIWESLEI